MNILAQIWNVWAPKDVIINAAQRVGISSTGLDVRKMEQDKYEQAAKCMDTESSQAPLCKPKKALRSSFSTIVSPLTPNSTCPILLERSFGMAHQNTGSLCMSSLRGTFRTAMKKV